MVLAPLNATQLLAFDATTEEIKGVDICTIGTGLDWYPGIGVVGDTVVLAPLNATQLLVFDVTTEEIKGVDI